MHLQPISRNLPWPLCGWEPRCSGKGAWPETLWSWSPRLPAGMGPQRLLSAVLFLAQVVPQEASQHCSRLEYWNPDNLCCGSCLQRFGPPPCPDYEFSENCGLNDFGDHVTHYFKKCPPGQCNPHNEELCSLCGGGARAPIPARTQPRCRERPAPAKETCLLKPETTSILSSQEPSSPAISIPSPTSEHTVQWQALLIFTLPLVLVLLMTSAAILLFALQRRSPYHPYPGLLCSDSNTSQGPLETSKTELPNLASQPLSRLLDELEVLEELIVLLDPEPGPGGPLSCGTTRHLAARYGLPAAWSTFAYSLRPSHSPLRALIEMVVAREPSASLGQLGTHLAQLGRADALQVLSKLA
ncbi:PREDICTED: IGF-like family receptor 1 isoform X2 [Miniopterus natalensis]|uniref:IGF-like family receptor 1 isoform X2 n=1 Tax=Miniopterus natalensis TaxID=291302 RepID=UPI0007A6DF26|nr:PREDICTED: IGF-like family receptor 1 isoform X2 [Miniopterus natalensis]XP_016076444.1 PREDICTED: IGF-like family receptor 1 isoform X2 [Miniopterus natalensis]XP_016076445.1 PREDICTED: IGF-like family receptor 1 isoform X2 [Miniopterus natalensis]